jgi:phosphohistidine swiveling domain-containing protein
MNFIFWPGETNADVDTVAVGGKARALLALQSSGLEIPPWFVVLPHAFDDSRSAAGHGAPPEIAGDSEDEAALATLPPSPAVGAEIETALARLCPDGWVVAVRSSARDEDGAAASFAGQLDSFLAVRPAEVADQVAAVWRSGFSAGVRAYRAQHGLDHEPDAPAVIVQRMVRADASGVAFGADPVTGSRDRLVVSAVPGLGLGLVSGEVDADTWHVDRSGRVLSRRLALKPDAWRITADGLAREPLSAEAAAGPALSDAQLAAVAEAVERAGRHFGTPQDIEWAVADGRLHLLQSRAITTPVHATGDDVPLAIWDNSNIVESYSGVTTPLTFSFAQRAYEGVYRQFCRILSVPAPRLKASDHVFRNMLGLHRGRIYYNLLNWYRVLALLPGFTLNRRFMEQMMGVKEPLPAEIMAGLARPGGLGARLRDGLDLAFSVTALIVNHWRLPANIRRFRVRLDDALRPPPEPFESLSTGALAASFQELEQRLLSRWDAPLLNDFFTMIFYGVLRDLTARWSGEADGLLQNDLLCDSGGMISAAPAQRIAELAQLAAGDTGFIALLNQATREEIDRAIDQRPGVRAACDAYLAQFGERCFDELKLESSTLLDDPLPLYRAVGRLASMPAPAPAAPPAEAHPRALAEARMTQALAGHPVRRVVFRWLLQHARSGVRERENLRFERTRLFGRVRRIFLAMGRQLQAHGHLDEARDVFYLEVGELLGFVSGTTTTVRLRELAGLRQAEFAACRQSPPLPNRFTTRGIPSRHLPAAETAVGGDAGDAEDTERRGLGCCPGVVRGRVCLVTDPARATVRPGEILVAERTDPGWIMLFPGAAGLLVERGSLLSHSAIVARELRLPAVVSISGLTTWLRDGDRVEFDGSSGRVRKLPAEDPDESTPSSIESMMAPS